LRQRLSSARELTATRDGFLGFSRPAAAYHAAMDHLVPLLEQTVRATLEARHRQRGGQTPLPADPAVFDDGLLDSLALAELITQVEASTGLCADMLRFDPLAVETASDLVRELAQALGLPA